MRKYIAVALLMALALLISGCAVSDMLQGGLPFLDSGNYTGKIVLEAQDMAGVASESEMAHARDVMEARMDAMNLRKRKITVEDNRIIIELRADEADLGTITEMLARVGMLTFQDTEGNILLTSNDIASVKTQSDQGQYNLLINFTGNGAKMFEEATAANIGQPMPIYLDDELLSAPTVNEAIASGQAVVTGIEDMREARGIADTVNAGALPYAFQVVSAEYTDTGN